MYSSTEVGDPVESSQDPYSFLARVPGTQRHCLFKDVLGWEVVVITHNSFQLFDMRSMGDLKQLNERICTG